MPEVSATTTITGTITRGRGVAGLRVVASTEVRVGIELEPKPCVMGLPRIQQVGAATTDAAGRSGIRFTAEERPEFACRFSATVSVSVFDGLVLVWRSPKVGVGLTVRFDHEIEPGGTGDEGQGTGSLRGRITECGHGAEAYRVLGFEEVTLQSKTTEGG